MSALGGRHVFKGLTHSSDIEPIVLDAPKLRGSRSAARVFLMLTICTLSTLPIVMLKSFLTMNVVNVHTTLFNVSTTLSIPRSALLFETATHAFYDEDSKAEAGNVELVASDEDVLSRVNPRWNSGEYGESAVVIDLVRTVGWLVQEARRLR